MKMYRDDIPDWLQTALVVFGLIGVCWFVLSSGKESSIPNGSPAPQSVSKPQEHFCGGAVVRCVAKAEIKLENASSDGCPEEKARKRIEAELVNPLEREDCKSSSLRLSESCPKGCSLENSPPLVVPGPLVFHSDTMPNESGICVATGQINVALRGGCRKNSDLPDSTIPTK